MKPEIYLIPKGFTGKVNIIFNQNGIPKKYQTLTGKDTVYICEVGTPIKYEKGTRVYEIPSDGILLTQFSDEYGFTNRKYFYVDEQGKRYPLETYNYIHRDSGQIKYNVKDIQKIGIFGDGTTGSYGNENIKYQEFVVSNYQNLQIIFSKEKNHEFETKVISKVHLTD
jgi:hypothetical protein